MDRQIEGVLVDLDGVLYVDSDLIAGAVDTLKALKSAGLPIRAVTNTTTKSTRTLAAKLKGLGLPLESDEIVTAPRAAVRYLETMDDPSVRLVLEDDAASDFSHFRRDDSRPDVVVVGDIGPTWDYALMSSLFENLVSGSRLVAMHKGRFYQGTDGLILDIGAFVAGLEHASGVEATVVGKPSSEFFRLAVSDMNVDPSNAVMIGDDIDSDVGGAQRAGLAGVLVRTGKYREHLVAKSDVKPDAIIDSIADAASLILGSRR